ncbi:MAG: tRNA 2-thiouridine(34) synthase MnmA [Candidatus Azambacteria bacterium]|nr:tRNA 2-thiouridine(34) synthase MnmA [Candidatus Azambacteria bacterium]
MARIWNKHKLNAPLKSKVFVAMSGGVDSSVAATLLKKQGYDVYGVFMRGFYPENIDCTWREDRRDAMRVAAILGIPFCTFNFSKEYKKYVIDYMVEEYRVGRTPNPDIMCNKYIKFDLFLKKSLQMGADKIATGHYVRRLETEVPSVKLLVARDKNKDQSYFLWTLTQKQLKHCLFPIGDYLKTDVRKLAKEFKLPVFDKRDSQGLCFIGEFNISDFLKNFIKSKQGNVINEKGEVVGRHDGIEYYTIGQRHGIGAIGGVPYYVIAKDVNKNILTVAEKFSEEKFFKKEALLADCNWISGNPPTGKYALSKKYMARVRYRQPLQICRLKTVNKKFTKVVFEEPQRAITPGQSLVIYSEDELTGGGVIV